MVLNNMSTFVVFYFVSVGERHNIFKLSEPELPFEQFKEGIKGKAIPLQACTGPEGSRRLRLPDFMTIGT
jgi:hypothetical protein